MIRVRSSQSVRDCKFYAEVKDHMGDADVFQCPDAELVGMDRKRAADHIR